MITLFILFILLMIADIIESIQINKANDTIEHLKKRICELEKFQDEFCKREVFKKLKEENSKL